MGVGWVGNHDGPRLCPLLSSGPRRSGLLLHPPHPPIYGKQTEPRRGREPWWRSLSRQTGAGTAGTQTQGPVPNPEGQRQPCLTAWAFIHSPWLREAAGSNTGGALPGVILTPCAKDGSSGSSQVVGVGGSRDSTSPAPWRHPPLDPAKGAAEDACRVLFTSSVCLVPRQAGQVGARVVLGEESGRRPGLQDSKAVSPKGPLLRRYEGLPLSVGLGNWNLRL